MGVVGSLPSNNNDIQKENSLPSADGSSNETVSVIPDVLKTNTSDNHTKPRRYCPYHRNSSVTTSLETDRCLKHEDEEAMEYEFPRRKHRETARRLKAHNLHRQRLEKQIHELELKQNTLISQIADLHLYKQQLQVKYNQIHVNLNLQIIK